jgi:hypothetical protein
VRVYLTNPELATDAGKQLLELTVRIAADGLIEPSEIEELHTWLAANKGNDRVAAIPYLTEMLSRITADGVVDRDELVQLHLAVERVIPAAQRKAAVQARKQRESAEKERAQESRRIEREKQEERKRQEFARQRRLRHSFAKVAGVTFPNDDGSERQRVLAKCKVGEQLLLRHDVGNEFSEFAIQVLRKNGEQLGHAPEYLAEQIHEEKQAGYAAIGILKNLTGGVIDRPTRGANFVVVFFAPDVTAGEIQQYANDVFASEGPERPFPLDLAALPRPLAGPRGDFEFEAPREKKAKPWWKFW